MAISELAGDLFVGDQIESSVFALTVIRFALGFVCQAKLLLERDIGYVRELSKGRLTHHRG
jgi:hypothetical protein